MRALLAQMTPEPGGIVENELALEQALLAHPDVDLAVFPELYFEGYDPARVRKLARPAEQALSSVSRAAAQTGTAVVVGFAESVGSAGVANSVGLIDSDGEISAVYRKTHLSGSVERETFTAGDRYQVAEIAGYSVAPLICFDTEFPEPARQASLEGAEILITVAANMVPYAMEQRLAAQARALENRRPHLYVNRSGREAGRDFVGGSCLIDIHGSVVVEADRGDLSEAAKPRNLICDIPIGDRAEPDVDFHRHLREPLGVQRTSKNPREGRET